METVAGLSQAEADVIPLGFNNNIRWNLGHIYVDQYLWIQTLTKEDIPFSMGFNKWFGYGTSPSLIVIILSRTSFYSDSV